MPLALFEWRSPPPAIKGSSKKMKTREMAEVHPNGGVSGVRRNNAGRKSSSKMKPVRLSAIRKSPRVRIPTKEAPTEKGHIQPLKKPRSYKRMKLQNQIPANEEARISAIRRAEELQSSLGSNSPSFVKSMRHSHVKASFCLNIHASFAKSHLPKHDEYLTLWDEDGNEFTAKYLAQQHGFSGGWIRFAKDHKLVDGDALVFQLIQPTVFKVYIVRVNDQAITGSVNPVNTDVHAKEACFNENRGVGGPASEKCSSHVPPEFLQGNVNESGPFPVNSNIQNRLELSVEERGNVHSSYMQDFTLTGCVTNFENFVNGESIEGSSKNLKKMKTTRKTELHPNGKVFGVRRNSAGRKSSSKMKAVCLSAIRKSLRVAAKEQPNEKGHVQPLRKHRSYERRNSGYHIPASEEARMHAIRLAEQLQSGLGSDSPSFVKSMFHSHVKVSFWLNIHASFARSYLPKHDESLTLRDDTGNEFPAKYLAQQHGLSGGWKRFAKDHKLVDGDALIFQLIQPTVFKVYIVRVNEQSIVGNVNPVNTVVHGRETCFNDNTGVGGPASEKYSSHVPPAFIQGNVNESDPLPVRSNTQNRLDPTVEERGNVPSSYMEDSSLTGCLPSFENFKVIVNGESIHHEFTKEALADYYNLCCYRKSYLHKNLRKHISGTLAVGIITRVINMANAIKECKLSSSTDDFEMWEKTLVAFEEMGMDVGFIRDRLKRLMSLVSESRMMEQLKRYEEVRNKRDCTEEEIMSLELNLLKLKHDKARLEDEMVDIRVNLHRYESVLEEDVGAPW